MLKIFQRSMKEPELREVTAPAKGTWIYAVDPNEEEIALLCEHGFDEDLIRDALDFFEVPRFEYEGKSSYFFTRFPYLEGDEVVTAPIMIAVGGGSVLTVVLREPPFISKLFEARTQFFTTQKTKVFLVLVSQINHVYTHYLTEIRRGVSRTRSNIRKIRNRDMVLLVNFENTLNDFITSLVPTNTALAETLSGKYVTLYEHDTDLVEDLQLENTQLIESCKSNLKTIQNIRSAYSTIMTNNLNQTIKFLTALTIIVTVPTMISSFFGMNVRLPLETHPYAFWLIILGTMFAMSIIAYIFAKREWI